MVYDANVFYPAPLRDLLMHLAQTGLFRAKWTEAIHDEWTRNLLKDRPELDPKRVERTRDLINQAVPDCLVKGYEPLIPSLTLPDPDDRHVLATAIRCNADAIITFNRRDFAASVLQIYDLEALHPDDFIVDLMDLDRLRVLEAVKRQRAGLKHPPKTAEELLETLVQQGLPRTVALLEQHKDLI